MRGRCSQDKKSWRASRANHRLMPYNSRCKRLASCARRAQVTASSECRSEAGKHAGPMGTGAVRIGLDDSLQHQLPPDLIESLANLAGELAWLCLPQCLLRRENSGSNRNVPEPSDLSSLRIVSFICSRNQVFELRLSRKLFAKGHFHPCPDFFGCPAYAGVDCSNRGATSLCRTDH